MSSAIEASYARIAGLVEHQPPSALPLGLQTITLFGRPGTGKSTIAANFPNHLYIDLERSATNLSIQALRVKTWAQFKDFCDYAYGGGDLSKLTPDKTKVDTVIIDTGTDLWELAVKHGLAERKLREFPDDYQRTRIAIRTEFRDVVGKLLSLHGDGKLGVVFICHEEVEEIKKVTHTEQVFRPSISDREIKAWIAAKPQMVMRTFITQVNPVDGVTPYDKPKFLLQCNSSGDVIKDRTKRLPQYVGATYEALERTYNKTTGETA